MAVGVGIEQVGDPDHRRGDAAVGGGQGDRRPRRTVEPLRIEPRLRRCLLRCAPLADRVDG